MLGIAKTFSAIGVTPEVRIKKDGSLHYKVDLSGDWDGTLVLRRTKDGGISYEPVALFSADDDGSVLHVIDGDYSYSFSCPVFTAGTAIVALNDLSADASTVVKTGLPNGAQVTAEEKSDGIVHRTVLKLESVPVSVVSVGAAAGVGGAKVYDFPQGRILMLGCMADLSMAIAEVNQADFTDATPEGDIAIGSVAPADADGLGTDATDDDMATATAFTMAAYAALPQIPSEASLQFDGTSTPLDMLVNALVDAADIDDDTTTEVLVSGTIVTTWINLGDF